MGEKGFQSFKRGRQVAEERRERTLKVRREERSFKRGVVEKGQTLLSIKRRQRERGGEIREWQGGKGNEGREERNTGGHSEKKKQE